MSRLLTLSATDRRTEGTRIVSKGLSYAISVFVSAAPNPGFAWMERWLAHGNEITRRIIKANLGKSRLSGKYPDEVIRLKEIGDGMRDRE